MCPVAFVRFEALNTQSKKTEIYQYLSIYSAVYRPTSVDRQDADMLHKKTAV